MEVCKGALGCAWVLYGFGLQTAIKSLLKSGLRHVRAQGLGLWHPDGHAEDSCLRVDCLGGHRDNGAFPQGCQVLLLLMPENPGHFASQLCNKNTLNPKP